MDKTNHDFVKINELEYMKNHEVLDDGFEDKLIVTLGSKGCRYKGQEYKVPHKVKDVSDQMILFSDLWLSM